MKLKYSKQLQYRILRACGFEPQAAKELVNRATNENLLMEQATVGLKIKESEETAGSTIGGS